MPPTVLEWPTPNSIAPSSPQLIPPPLENFPPPTFEYAMFDPVLQSSADFAGPSSHGSPSSVDAEPDLEHDDEEFDSIHFEVDYVPSESMRLRQATFSTDELEGVDGPDDASDVLMTPAESDLDEEENMSSPAP